MRFINLTPHEIMIGSFVFSPSGSVARVSVDYEAEAEIEGVQIYSERTGPVEGLPEPEGNTIYIV
ncbi:MAG: hypothetical protein DRN81_05495, partial [Thermoproteota archaeon]